MIRTRTARSAAFALLVAQMVGGGLVALAHNRAPLEAPRRVESAQHDHCPVLHDATMCVVCSFSHNRAAAPVSTGVVLASPTPNHTWSPNVAGPKAVPAPRTGDARAPPHSQV